MTTPVVPVQIDQKKSVSQIIKQCGRTLAAIDAPDWYTNPAFRAVLLPDFEDIWSATPLRFAAGMHGVLTSPSPPPHAFFENLPRPVRRLGRFTLSGWSRRTVLRWLMLALAPPKLVGLPPEHRTTTARHMHCCLSLLNLPTSVGMNLVILVCYAGLHLLRLSLYLEHDCSFSAWKLCSLVSFSRHSRVSWTLTGSNWYLGHAIRSPGVQQIPTYHLQRVLEISSSSPQTNLHS